MEKDSIKRLTIQVPITQQISGITKIIEQLGFFVHFVGHRRDVFRGVLEWCLESKRFSEDFNWIPGQEPKTISYEMFLEMIK